MSPEIALVAIVLEAIVSYPDALYRAFGHPVTWIGRLIGWCDRNWNDEKQGFEARRLRGVATVLLLLAVSLATGLLLQSLLPALVCGVLGSSLLAQRSLDTHVVAVARALETGGIEAGRHAVSMIVGRDTRDLTEAGVSRAAIESLAENFSDGIVAPLFWMAAAGLPGAIAYKAINTGDSMIGHKSDRHLAFGWAAARLDDLVNLPASRLAALWLVLGAALHRGMSPGRAWRTVWRDARHHESPNAGWPESAMAGALGYRLAGPRSYDGDVEQGHWIGDGRSELRASDIREALRLYRTACVIQAVALAVLFALSVA
ncbi:MAG: cobalamin biosynthesis protein CobD [Reyranella sp.]|uniref:adenosylcobinamide-phosphate synthase CbiB n=1 Tax=Reyranella sp. TaxID=1929291 RepID=UPI001202E8ED|nr:adenosylcobinamide-phosphate synthase CbiB [Reyranella sp.]TAJ91921.1 MAG: cobalamin biosynthesis protein CobD [Reyranella sp.]TBR28101.1 MAG: cobalamin biosynthesis protein CobD [Reyranella sp.]